MNKYFNVVVQTTSTNSETDKVTKTKEQYLVHAVSVTDAEAIVTKHFEESNLDVTDFRVVKVDETKILDVLKA
jgi:hypothetical protein